ncbi:MAG: 50S ribosomal protein L1 [Rickettsiales bacterium]|jgi:large subunit ribosomal protein L1|nr:50S ribosomal protein L1 [Rickettsiales bacterium]
MILKKKKVETDKSIKIEEAIEMLKKSCQEKQRKFIENVDIAINLSVDVKQTSQNIRGSILLPAGTGKSVKVIVFTEDNFLIKEAMDAGAIEAGFDELVSKIESGWLGFDYVVATPDSMKKLGKLAKILGPRGLMPNPKNGNIVTEVGKAVKEIMNGRVNFKNDKFGIVHVGIGKIDFKNEDLISNIKAIVSAVKDAKPESVKGKYIKNAYITSTMGPSFLIDLK